MIVMKKEFKLGVFVVAVIVASFFVLNYLRGEDIFDREQEVIARYQNVEGLVASAPVYIKGYKAGKVSEVYYDSETEDFLVTCSVLKDFHIPVDSKMVIYGVDVMGTKGVRIDLGTSEQLISDGGTLAPTSEAGLIDGLASSVTPLICKVVSTLDSLQTTITNVNALLSESNRASLGNTLAHIEYTMSNLKSLVKTLNGNSSEINQFMDNISDFSSKLVGLTEKIDTSLTGVDKLVGTLNEADIDETVKSFRSLLENINDPDGSIGKLFVDDSVYNSVDSLLTDVDKLVKKISENPKKYFKISVF